MDAFFDGLEFQEVHAFLQVCPPSCHVACLLNQTKSAAVLSSLQSRLKEEAFFTLLHHPVHSMYSVQVISNAAPVLQMILGCPGCIFFTGVGKSGFIAQKLSQVMVSTGTKAMFLSPTDALHGDIGSVASGDLVIFISKSGATEELLTLLPFIRVRPHGPFAPFAGYDLRELCGPTTT